jgi:branched-chain amino acid transport system ATP-binding protein
VLELDSVHAAYGETAVLFGISLTVKPGQVSVLFGRNGAGKTTTLKAIVGLVATPSGSIRFSGEDLVGTSTYLIARKGIAYVPEERRIISGLTVEENLRVARRSRATSTAWPIKRAYALFPELAALRNRPGPRLSGGEQQMLCIARALMTGPSVLLLDEPSEGLAPAVIEVLRDRLLELKRGGLAILLVEQNDVLVSSLADTVHVIEKGVVRYSGSLAEFRDAPQIREQFLSLG